MEQRGAERTDRTWEALHLENEYLRVMVLPEIGGRIHVGLDRTNGYDFFYRQNVIKPALVGLLGPWISGGVELNWPQHHRPSNFMPVDWAIEDREDGGKTIWCSEHEPMGRMKGMHGVTLRPGSSVIELRVRLFNRTAEVRTFLWWANVCARVHDQYQSFFPPDVKYVFDHAKRAVSTFPVARGVYYGVDYGRRAPQDADLSWYRNIPVPTSYMVTGTKGDFFGGYDHEADAGFVHWADHRISPGKKQWTWGNGDFGYAWDRELTDSDGPYVELMAGVFTDNQPDFSFLMPYATKTFSQYWYPFQRIGPPQAATLDGALSLSLDNGSARLGAAVTSERPSARVQLMSGDQLVWERVADLAPGQPLVAEGISLPAGARRANLRLSLYADGRELVAYCPESDQAREAPEPAHEPPVPARVASTEDLYLTGLHLWQYSHPTRRAEGYWREALRRDTGDARSNNAMGWWHFSRGEPEAALSHFLSATAKLTSLNPNPYDAGPLYGLGLALRSLGRLDEADEALAKAAWSDAWRCQAQFARAQLAGCRGELEVAIGLLGQVIESCPDQTLARGLRAAMYRRLGRVAEARADICAVLAADPLDALALDQRSRLVPDGAFDRQGNVLLGPSAASRLPGGVQTALDVAYDYAAAGLLDEATNVLRQQLPRGRAAPAYPMLRYTLAWLLRRAGDPGADAELRLAAQMPTDYCFPARTEEMKVLQSAMEADPGDARAPYYLGNLLYDKRRYQEAISAWRRAAELDPSFPTVHRNLGLAEFNVLGRPEEALACYYRAFHLDPTDARVLYELDQLRRRCGNAPGDRLKFLERYPLLLQERDDLATEHVTLLNLLRRYEEALAVLKSRRFHPWEGGEGLVSAQWVLANVRLAQAGLRASDPDGAIAYLREALRRPENLGEGKHLLTPEAEVHYHLGLALRAAGREDEAREWFSCASSGPREGQLPLGEAAYWQAKAKRALGDEDGANDLLSELLAYARQRALQEQRVDYFATSLPTFLVFEDDLDRRNQVECYYLQALALAGLGRRTAAVKRFREVLALDVAHEGAAWHLQALIAGR